MNTLYSIIEQAIRSFATSVEVPNTLTENDIYMTIRQVMRENPDIFWFSHQWRYVQNDHKVFFSYTIGKKRAEKAKKQIAEVIEKDFRIEEVRKQTPVEQVMYIYKWLALYCDYSVYSAYNQTIYSVFVYRNSVCTGYSKAAQYLFGLLGIESKLVFGKIKNSEEGSCHCWLVVNIEGTWYHLDPTMSSPLLDKVAINAGVRNLKENEGIYFWSFCLSSNNIQKYYEIDDDTLPPCDSDFNQGESTNLQKINIYFRDEIKGVLLSNKGVTSSVYSCVMDKNIVLKYIDGRDVEYVRNEFLYMDRLRDSQYVLHIIDKYCDVENNIIAMERATPLMEWMKTPQKFRLRNLLEMAIDVAKGIDDCYWHSIFYRDIHLNNIFIDRNGHYKLGDFGGCSFVIQHYGLLINDKIEGSPWFMAPESYKDSIFNIASATYSISMLIYFVLNGMEPPFWDKYGSPEAYKERCNGVKIPTLSLDYINDTSIKDALNAVLSKGLSFNYEDRYKSIERFIHDIDGVLKVLDGRNYTLPLPNTEDRFNKTRIGKRFSESISSEDDKVDKSSKSVVSANITCLNCGHKYNVNVLKTLLNDLPLMLEGDSALGGLSLYVEKDTDVFECPQCSYSTTIAECVEHHAIALSTNADDFNRTYIPGLNSPHAVEDVETDFCTTAFSFNGKRTTNRNQSERNLRTSQTFIPALNILKSSSSFFSHFFQKKLQDVYGSVFAPAEVKSKSRMMVQVYLHLNEETEKVKALATEADKNAERRGYIPLQTKLKKGDKVDVVLNINGDKLLYDSQKSIIWQGSFCKCAFDYLVPSDMNVSELSCSVSLYVNGAIVGEMLFYTQIVDSPAQLNANVIAKPVKKLFISYSHNDLKSAEKIAKLYEGMDVDVFFDKHRLKSGYIYSEEIFNFINKADTFVLCWSENAAQSDYVEKERKAALELAYPNYRPREDAQISIKPYNIQPYATPPEDMIEHYHFEEL